MIDATTTTTYTYIGLDAGGLHHHLYENTVYVTDEDAEADRSGIVHRYTVRGDVKRTEDLSAHDSDLETWAEFVADRRGWEEFALTTISLAGIGDHFDTRSKAI